MQSTVVHGCSLWNMNALILFYFYHQHWIGAGSRRSQCDEGFGGGLAWRRGGTIHMSCYYSNCWPGARVSDYCLLTTFKQASCWMPSNAVTKLCTSASREQRWGQDEASFHGDRLSFLCYSIFLLTREVSATICAQAWGACYPSTLATSKRDNCQTVPDLIGSDLFKTFLDV